MARTEVQRFEPASFAELKEFAVMCSKSGMVPVAYKDAPDAILVAFQMGAELGLKPLQALQNIAVINGRPSVWGDAILALVLSHPECIDVRESMDEAGTLASCTVLRRGREPVTREFSMADAKTAGLTGKQGPWQTYPRRMLAMRARAFACRDAFADALRGITSAEEAGDLAEIDITARGETVHQQTGETRQSAALRAMGEDGAATMVTGQPETPPAPAQEAKRRRPENKAKAERLDRDAAIDAGAVDPATGEINMPPPPADEPPRGERQTVSDKPTVPATDPETLKAAKGAIDRAMNHEDVNAAMRMADGFSPEAKRAVMKWAGQRMQELSGHHG